MTSPLGTLIQRTRKAKGMTQQQLADIVRVARTTITMLEIGEIKRSNDAVLQRIAVALELPLSMLTAASFGVVAPDPTEDAMLRLQVELSQVIAIVDPDQRARVLHASYPAVARLLDTLVDDEVERLIAGLRAHKRPNQS